MPWCGGAPPCAERWQRVTNPWDGYDHPPRPPSWYELPELGLLLDLLLEPFQAGTHVPIKSTRGRDLYKANERHVAFPVGSDHISYSISDSSREPGHPLG